MDSGDDDIRRVRSLGERFWSGLRASMKSRPVSFYLLLAMIVMLLLGSRIFQVMDDPRQFVLYLSLYFLFFFVLMFRAIMDAFDIARDHFRKKEKLFRETFVADGFADRLGSSVAQNNEDTT